MSDDISTTKPDPQWTRAWLGRSATPKDKAVAVIMDRMRKDPDLPPPPCYPPYCAAKHLIPQHSVRRRRLGSPTWPPKRARDRGVVIPCFKI